jgi:DNA processing protein
MAPTEIWLRLMKVSNLYGDNMVMAARILRAASVPDREALYACGLSAAQAKQFLSVANSRW